jgi:large subunit ribosomal protein L25
MVPAVIYGHKEKPVSIQLDHADVERLVAHHMKMVSLAMGRKKEQALVKEVQFDPLGEEALHVDFERIAMDEVIEVECPLEFTGTPKGASEGGVVEHPITDLTVRCLPGNIPESIRVSMVDLEIGDTVTVADITPPEGVEILTEQDAVLATVRPPVMEEEAEEALPGEGVEAPIEEPEVIGREKETEEEEPPPEEEG